MNAIVALFLLAVGIAPAVAISGASVLAVPLAGATTGLVCAVAVMGSLATRTPLLPCFVVVALAANGLAGWWLRHSGAWAGWTEALVPPWRGPRADHRRDAATLAIVSALAAPVLFATRSAPVAWDPRSIWFFHASWFHAGGARAVSAMTNRAFSFHHPDYPPLAPASSAALWLFYRGEDRWVAMSMNVWLSLSAVVLVGVLVARLVRPRAQLAASVVGGLLALGLFGASGGTAMEGLVDLLWATWFLAGALSMLVLPVSRTNQLVGATCLAAAAMTKAEGLALTVVVLVALVLRCRGHLATAVLPTVSLVLPVAWAVLVWMLGVTSTEAINGPGLRGLLSADPAVWARVGPTLSSLLHQLWPMTFAAAMVLGLAGLLLTAHRRRIGMGSGMWLAGLAAVGVALFVVVYVTGGYEINWWLRTSVSRTMIAIRALLLTELAIALVLIVDLVRCGPVKRP